MIYLVEDDSNIRELVVYTLNQTGLEAKGFGLPSQFWSAVEQQTPELVLLDIMLPEERGLDILARLRRTPGTTEIPVMMLTAKDSEYDKVVGLDRGADDYLAKPFGMMELTARVRALLRRTAREKQEPVYQLDSLTVWPEKRRVQVAGAEAVLTRKEFDLLCLLLKNEDRVVTREQLIREVWGYTYQGESRTVDVHVRTLRQKLGQAGDLIETVRGVGYRIRRTADEA
ncbi:MAG: response regulator transcription factor [Clostridiales bacterium]|nr:response regulator transcription factor [Clostridiales bacterium]